MKIVDADQFATRFDQYLLDLRSEAIVVTKAGRPCAVVHGLNYDDEQFELVDSPKFWTMIEQRRREPTIPWEVAKQQLESLDE